MLQSDVNTIFNELKGTILTLVGSKYKYMMISRLKSNSVAATSLTFHGQQTEKVSSYKCLGVNITDDLSCSTHINQITSKIRKKNA